MAATSQHRCVFVGNIPYDATEEQLIQICEEVGPVVSFRLVIDRETGKPKGYGFCEYKDEETALSARRNLQGYEINGRQLRVDFAENDKGADRNREQGRGGPGLASNVGGPAVLGDSALYQPIGLQLSATAASVMAGALGGAQTDNLPSKQNGFQGQSSLGNDQLTHYLSKMSRKQLHEVISDIKVMTTQNKELARQLLLASPQLPKALFQAAIMLGMVTPQMLQMPNLRQTPGSISQSQRQDGMPSQKPSLPPHPGQASFATNKVQVGVVPSIQESQLPSLPQNTLGSNQPPPMHFPHVSMPPRFPHPQQTQSALMLPTTVAGQSGVSSGLTPRPFNNLAIRPQPPTLDNSSLKQQMLLPFVHNPGPAVLGNNAQSILPNATPQHSQSVLPTATPQHSVLSRPPSVQASFQIGSLNSVTSLGVSGSINKQTDARLTDDKTWKSRSNTLPEHMVIRGNSSEPSSHPSKLMRLEEGRSTFSAMSQSSNATRSGPTSVLETGSLPTSRVPTAEVMQHSEKQVPQLQLAPEVESALLQQVMSLTAEQLSSLPPEQRQQVLQLQQMLR